MCCSFTLENDGFRLIPDRSGRIEAWLSNLPPASAITLIVSLYCAPEFVVARLESQLRRNDSEPGRPQVGGQVLIEFRIRYENINLGQVRHPVEVLCANLAVICK